MARPAAELAMGRLEKPLVLKPLQIVLNLGFDQSQKSYKEIA